MTTATEGYKGHRKNSKAERAHRLIDEHPKAAPKDLVPKLRKLGITAVTAAHWIYQFRNVWGQKGKAKPTAKKKAAKAKTKKTAAKPDTNATTPSTERSPT